MTTWLQRMGGDIGKREQELRVLPTRRTKHVRLTQIRRSHRQELAKTTGLGRSGGESYKEHDQNNINKQEQGLSI